MKGCRRFTEGYTFSGAVSLSIAADKSRNRLRSLDTRFHQRAEFLSQLSFPSNDLVYETRRTKGGKIIFLKVDQTLLVLQRFSSISSYVSTWNFYRAAILEVQVNHFHRLV